MDTKTGGGSPPAPQDLDGWRNAIAEDRLKLFRPEALVCAFQDLGKRDKDVKHALAKHLSGVIVKILGKRVAFTRHNREDIISRVHAEIWKTLLRPTSADGRALRVAFGIRVEFRLKDAIAKEYRESRVGEVVAAMSSQSSKTDDPDQSSVIEIDAAEENDLTTSDRPGLLEVDTATMWGGSPLQNFHKIEEQLNVNSILSCIHNDQKRLAFRLFMDGMPLGSKSANVDTIAKAVGRTERTVRTWIEEVQTLLKKNEGVTHLAAMRGGR